MAIYNTYLELGPLGEVPVSVSYNYYKGYAGKLYGDDPQPPEAECVELETAFISGTNCDLMEYLPDYNQQLLAEDILEDIKEKQNR